MGGYGYTPQSQSLLDPSEGYTPSATLTDSGGETYSQSLVDEQGFWKPDTSLERELSTDTYSSPTVGTTSVNVEKQSGGTSIFTGIVDIFTGIIGAFSQKPKQQVVYQPPPKPKVPTWVMPAAITAGAGVLVLALVSVGGRRRRLSGYGRKR
jgi:hypothetical protein